MTPAQIAAVAGLVLLLLIIVYYLYASSSSSSSSSSTATPVAPPAGSAAANSPTTTYKMMPNTWIKNPVWSPSGGCPGNQSPVPGWCMLPEAQAEALCSASSDCQGYGPNMGFYQLFPTTYPPTDATGFTLYVKS